MPASGDKSRDFHPERRPTFFHLSSQSSSSMLAGPRVQQPHHPLDDGRQVDHNARSWHGGFFPSTSAEKMPGLGGPTERLPSLSQLLNRSSSPPPPPPPPPPSLPRPQQAPATPLSLPPPPPAVLQQHSQTSSHSASAPLERPSTTQERRYDAQPSHMRTSSEGQLGHREAFFYDSWRSDGRDRQTPLVHPRHLADPPPPPPMLYHSGLVAPSSPQLPGTSGSQTAGIAHASGQWQAIPESPQSTSSSLAAGTTSRATVQKERPTGTRRLLGERNIPGEGRMFVYDDGTKIPTSVDGEPVNGQWGMTKAGRPRKRMPQACIPCRQKKIKCDPGEGKCAQCEKSGKECQYSHGQRGQKSDPTSPRTAGPATPTTTDGRAASPSHTATGRAPNELKRRRSFSVERQDGHKRTFSNEETSWSPERSFKRIRTESESERMRPSTDRLSMSRSGAASPRWQDSSSTKPVVSEHLVGYGCWAAGVAPEGFMMEDPFVAEREKALRYLRLFFERINSGTYCVFPRTAIINWALGPRKKSQEELMTLYALLADGALFSLENRNEARIDSERYLRTARTAIELFPRRQGLQILLARMIAGHIYVVRADLVRLIEINDVCRAVKLLKYDLTDRLGRPDIDGLYDFGMNQHGLEELYRRTEWLAFLIDRYIAMNLNYPICIHKEGVFLKLPCDESDYDRQAPSRAAFFDNGVISRSFTDSAADHASQSPWAYFLQGISFASDIWTAAMQSEWQDPSEYPGNCDAFARQTAYALDRWYERLPAKLRTSDGTTFGDSLQSGELGLLLGIEAAYHMGHMSLNRRVRYFLLPGSSISTRVRAAMAHAEQFLRNLKVVHAKLHDARRNRQSDSLWFTPAPFVRYAILMAVDILTACGNARDLDNCNRLVDLCETGIEFVDQISALYASSRPQCIQMRSRMKELRELLFSGANKGEVVGWACRNRLDPQTSKKMDLFYKETGGVTDCVLEVNGVNPQSMRVIEIQQESNMMGSLWGEAAGQRNT